MQETARGEANRLDSSAPSRARLQIDDLSRQQPNSIGNTAGIVNGSSTGLSLPSMAGTARNTFTASVSGRASHSVISSSHGGGH
jgi:hypothetical protein